MSRTTFTTNDLNLSAFIIANGFALDKIDRPVGSRIFRFTFNDPRNLCPALVAQFSRNSLVQVLAFTQARRDLLEHMRAFASRNP